MCQLHVIQSLHSHSVFRIWNEMVFFNISHLRKKTYKQKKGNFDTKDDFRMNWRTISLHNNEFQMQSLIEHVFLFQGVEHVTGNWNFLEKIFFGLNNEPWKKEQNVLSIYFLVELLGSSSLVIERFHNHLKLNSFALIKTFYENV